MASISSILPELLREIIGMLDHRTMKTVRLVSKCHLIVVEPLIFSEAVFDLDIGGIDGLVSIVEDLSLRQHVHSIRLRRRGVPKDFGAIEDWRGSIV
jgi:hypothetical protein